jgi:large subunit ribosomal protein L24e
MAEKRNCSFCGNAIEPGTGKMFIKKDGTVYYFCNNKCKKNRIDLGRVPRRTRWTIRHAELKATAIRRQKGEITEEEFKEGQAANEVAKKQKKIEVTKEPKPTVAPKPLTPRVQQVKKQEPKSAPKSVEKKPESKPAKPKEEK